MWASAGVLVQDGDAWVLTADGRRGAASADRAGDLRGAARRPACRVRARPFAGPPSRGGAFAVAALPVLEVDAPEAALEVLSRRGLVAGPTRDPSLGPSYAYRHALLRDAGYASLARAERAKLHLRLADWLAAIDASAEVSIAEVVARHYAAALETAPRLVRVVDGRPIGEIRAAAADWFERATAVARAVAAWETAAVARRAGRRAHTRRRPLRTGAPAARARRDDGERDRCRRGAAAPAEALGAPAGADREGDPRARAESPPPAGRSGRLLHEPRRFSTRRASLPRSSSPSSASRPTLRSGCCSSCAGAARSVRATTTPRRRRDVTTGARDRGDDRRRDARARGDRAVDAQVEGEAGDQRPSRRGSSSRGSRGSAVAWTWSRTRCASVPRSTGTTIPPRRCP